MRSRGINNVVEAQTDSLENVQNLEQEQKSKLDLKSLKDSKFDSNDSQFSDIPLSVRFSVTSHCVGKKRMNEEFEPNIPLPKNKPRAVVDLKMMQEELKQLEDPPLTALEREMCSNRLSYTFFDCPCEELAQKLLGNVIS